MSETIRISDQYFIGTSEPVKLDDKRRFTLPRRIVVRELPEQLVIIRGGIDTVPVLGLFAAIPRLKDAGNEAEHALFAFSRAVKLDTQHRLLLMQREAEHLASTDSPQELVVVGRGLSAVVFNSRSTEQVMSYYSGQLCSEGQVYYLPEASDQILHRDEAGGVS